MASFTLYPLSPAASCARALPGSAASRRGTGVLPPLPNHHGAAASWSDPAAAAERGAACARISCAIRRRAAGTTVACHAAAPDAPARLGRPVVEEHVARAAATLDQMLSTIMREMFVDQAAAFVTDEKPELEQCQAIRNAVAERIEVLDANFLAALNGYIQVAARRQEEGLQELLEAVRDEVLRQVAMRLPPAARVMDAAMQQEDKDRRLTVLRATLLGEQLPSSWRDAVVLDGEDDLPSGVTLDELMTTATQLIDDMEEQEVIADRRLLARLCLVREELRWLETESGFTGELPSSSSGQSLAARFARKNVPQRCIAFLKELLLVNDTTQRVGLLKQALTTDWEGAAPTISSNKQQRPPSSRGGAQQQQEAPDFVRPGRFMATVHALETQLVESMEQGVGPAAEHDPQQTARVLKRLGDVRMEAVAVLDAMQRGEPVTQQ